MKNDKNINARTVLEKITPVIEQIVIEKGLIPLEIEFKKENNKWFLKIFLYKDSESITHQDCEKVTRNLDEYIDQLIPVPYYLEVSSPGLDRKLKSSKEYIIFKGKEATVKLKKPLEEGGSKTFDVEIIDYKKPELKVRILLSEEELIINEDNIKFVKLIPNI